MTFGAALSEHPVAAHATGEVLGQVLEAVGEAPDLALLVASAAHTGTLEDVVAAVRTILRPGTLLGATASTVVAGRREVEDDPAIALWAGRTGPVAPVRLATRRAATGTEVTGVDELDTAPGDVLLLLADPFTFPADGLVGALAVTRPGLRVIGGLASAARGPGGNRLVLDGALHAGGAVGALLRADQVGATVVSQGCCPVGEPMVVTGADGSIIQELAGRPALERLAELATTLGPADQELLAAGIHLGVVVDEQRDRFDRGDFLVRGVLGGDRAAGAIAVDDEVPVGATVQFHVRDATTADEDLRDLLVEHRARGALLFTCNGRGTHLFGGPDHDAAVVDEALGAAVAGMSCAGELGPVGGRSFLHTYSAAVLTFP